MNLGAKLSKFSLLISFGFLFGCSHIEGSKPTEVQLMINNDKEYQDWVARAKSVDWDDLKKTHEMTDQYVNDYPNSTHALYISAVMAGDYSELLSLEEERKIKAKSVSILFKLMERLGELRHSMRQVIRNEYYYHSGQFLAQYLLGCEEKGLDISAGNFSIGVGASEHAFALLKEGRTDEAKYFAQKSVESWKIHAKNTPKWQFPYPYFYIQALSISGSRDEAYAELERIKKTSSYEKKKPIYDKYEARLQLIEKMNLKGGGE